MKMIGLIIIGGCALSAILIVLEILWSRYRIWREEIAFDRMIERNNKDMARREKEIQKYYDGFKHIKPVDLGATAKEHGVRLSVQSPKKPKKNKYGPRPNNLSAAERKRLLKKGMEIIEGGGK